MDSKSGTGFPRGGVFAASVDAIVVMSEDGLVTDWNPAAERVFGRGRSEVLGRELAELIIPPALRSRHRSALDRFRETGEATVLHRRLELFGMHASGRLIAVELTITQIEDAPDRLFAGFIRERGGQAPG